MDNQAAYESGKLMKIDVTSSSDLLLTCTV